MPEIVTSDRKMQEIIMLAKTVAQSKASVLIQGEAGTGKELMSRLIHRNSPRLNRSFASLNCSSVPENLIESELLGFERGAFSGANTSKAGKFETANGGTLLLAEVSELNMALQAKLLRVLQENEVQRIGGRNPIRIDVRIVATTTKNLSDCVKEGKFREDLYYRLNVVNLEMPPVRERIGDIKRISEFFLRKFAEKNRKPLTGFTVEAMQKLESHQWPGNVQELKTVIERSAIITKGSLVQGQDVMIEVTGTSNTGEAQMIDEKVNWIPGQTLDDVERFVILEALHYHQGNRTHTAKALGISIRTLRNKLSEYRRMGIYV